MNLTIGTTLQGQKYKIIRVLGQGSFGVTYLAEHIALNRKVAIKEFFMHELNQRNNDGSITGMSEGSMPYNYARKFIKEAQNMASIEHPNIVRVTDSFEENNTYYYVMDFIDGTNLNDYIKTNTISPSEAVNIIKDVADALIYMHEQKHMLHLDLKPGNIMRRKSDGHIYLIDFGLSKHYSGAGQPETSTTIGLGTAGYAPIEQGNQARNGEFRPTIDVYALGATLFKLLTGETPPPASDIVSDDELLANRLSANGINGSIKNVVIKAMSPNVKKRIQTMRDFKNLLPADTNDESTIIGSPTGNDESTIVESATTNISQLVNKETSSNNNPTNNNSANTTTKEDNGSSKQVIIVFAIVCSIIMIFIFAKGCGNKTEQAPAEDTVDTVAVDTVMVDTVAADYYDDGYYDYPAVDTVAVE